MVNSWLKDPGSKIIRQLGNQSGNRLSPDGKTIVTAGWTTEDTVGQIVGLPSTHIWKISLDGNKSEKITNENRSYMRRDALPGLRMEIRLHFSEWKN